MQRAGRGDERQDVCKRWIEREFGEREHQGEGVFEGGGRGGWSGGVRQEGEEQKRFRSRLKWGGILGGRWRGGVEEQEAGGRIRQGWRTGEQGTLS